MTFEYDNSADVLYLTLEDRPPEQCRFVENKHGDVLRIDKNTGEIIGVTIISFLLRIKKGLEISVPEIGPIPFKKQAARIMKGEHSRAQK